MFYKNGREVALLLIMLTPYLAFAQNSSPIRLGSSTEAETYAYPEDIQENNNGFSIKLILNYKQPRAHNDGQLVKSLEMYVSASCRPRLMRLNRIIPLTGPMGSGDVLSSAQPVAEWKKMESGEILYTLANQLCK
jgi:hypothetical protein